MVKKIKRFIGNKIVKILGNPKLAANYYYKQAFGTNINWNEPQDLNQWINWLSFNTDTSIWSVLADKYLVREYVAKKGLANHLVPLLFSTTDIKNLNINQLPPHS